LLRDRLKILLLLVSGFLSTRNLAAETLDNALKNCNAESFQALPEAQKLPFLSDAPFSCLYFLWTYQSETAPVWTKSKLLVYVNRLEQNLTLPQLRNIFFVTRLGFYHESRDPELARSLKEIKPLLQERLRPNAAQLLPWKNNSKEYLETLNELIALIDTSWLSPAFTQEIKSTLDALTKNPELHTNNRGIQDLSFSLMYLLQRACYEPAFCDKIDSKDLANLKTLAQDHSLTTEQNYFLINNSIWSLSAVAAYKASARAEVNAIFSDLLQTYSRKDEAYLWIVKGFSRVTDCLELKGSRKICKSEEKEEIKQKLFAQTFQYSNPNITFFTSLSKDRIDALVHEAGLVDKQFFALIGKNAKPVTNDKNTQLKVYLYQSKKDYDTYHNFLFDLSTNSGGIYLEEISTFFTYDRKESESLYSMTELFKHEYSHYLIGRYLVEGEWGKAQIYADNRMVWFDEGLAEFLAGANSGPHVDFRPSLSKQILSDSVQGQNLLTIRNILHSSYTGDFKFYRYAAAFFQFLYDKDRNLLANILRSVKKGDTKDFDAIREKLASDSTLENNFRNHLNLLNSKAVL